MAGIVFIQSPYGGAPVASDMLVDEAIAGPVEYLLENVLVRTARHFYTDATPMPSRTLTAAQTPPSPPPPPPPRPSSRPSRRPYPRSRATPENARGRPP